MDWKKLTTHPAADKFPLLAGRDLVNLAGSIQAKGQRFPIVLTDEETPRVLDGRNRLAAFVYLAAQGVNLEPVFDVYSGPLSAEDYVQCVNWERMHLNGAQRAALAVLMIENPITGAQLKQEAKKSQGKRNDLTSASVEAQVGHGKVAAKVADIMKVSRAQVERADHVRRENPEGFQRLKDGTSTVNAEHSKLSKREQKKADDADFAEKLGGFFKAMSAFKELFRSLKLSIQDVPSNLDDERRGQYLAAALDLQNELTILIRKLQ